MSRKPFTALILLTALLLTPLAAPPAADMSRYRAVVVILIGVGDFASPKYK